MHLVAAVQRAIGERAERKSRRQAQLGLANERAARTNFFENFQSALNKLGSEGWEATSGVYSLGEAKKVSLGQGMPPSIKVGASAWVALMKRSIPD